MGGGAWRAEGGGWRVKGGGWDGCASFCSRVDVFVPPIHDVNVRILRLSDYSAMENDTVDL